MHLAFLNRINLKLSLFSGGALQCIPTACSLFCDYLSMKQLFQNLPILASIAMFTVIMMTFIGMSDLAYVEEYDFVAGIHNEVTFHFRDGVETKFSCFLNYI